MLSILFLFPYLTAAFTQATLKLHLAPSNHLNLGGRDCDEDSEPCGSVRELGSAWTGHLLLGQVVFWNFTPVMGKVLGPAVFTLTMCDTVRHKQHTLLWSPSWFPGPAPKSHKGVLYGS